IASMQLKAGVLEQINFWELDSELKLLKFNFLLLSFRPIGHDGRSEYMSWMQGFCLNRIGLIEDQRYALVLCRS
ncbi:MAG TPA: hypothetical protein VM432_03550, partial [Bdellovibrionales bacterium]|nr:hypothetical protein [Bdellovibrionales bacterium]